MNIAQIEKNLSDLVKNISPNEFIYDLLLAYGTPKMTVTLLKKGKRNLSKVDGQIILKRKLLFQEAQEQDLHGLIDNLKNDEATYRHEPRFIVVTDYKTLLAIDTKTDDTLDIRIEELNKHPFFFGPWAKIEKSLHHNEQAADVKAAEKMAKIYDEILKDNHFETHEDLHGLNIFLSRLLFCFFAEDTGIFEAENAFTNFVATSQEDGSDLNDYLHKLFRILNTPDRIDCPGYLAEFPYVNGGLFGDQHFVPQFSRKARRMIIECGDLDWSAINPDIFGSMFQAVVQKEQRSSMGQHYTSVPNIMKVIEPLFLNELREKFDEYYDSQKKLEQLLVRLENLRIFDPACGSGNFLIIAYKEIRELEMEIFKRIQEITDSPELPFSRIKLSQFYGIEIDDFAHEIAILALWLAEHQMNVKFKEVFGQTNPTLPLKEGGNIVCANATRIHWEEVCPKDKNAEIYILGNPPYLGSSRQDNNQKEDMSIALSGKVTGFKSLDYISIWFIKGTEYIKDIKSKLVFVTTSSISQGQQVEILWPYILRNNIFIFLAYNSFKWTNNAKKNAGVYVSIVGLSNNKNDTIKTIYDGKNQIEVSNINAYLVAAKNIFIQSRKLPLNGLPKMVSGLKAGDDGNLILSKEEKATLLAREPRASQYIKKYIGAKDFLNSIPRFCIWVKDNQYEDAKKIPALLERFKKLKEFRQNSKKDATRKKAQIPYAFDETNQNESSSILIPQTSSERREHLPIGFLGKDYIISNGARVIYSAPEYIFGILSSKMHMAWVKSVAGRLGISMQYSNTLCYNTFPVPDLTEKQKEIISTHVYNVLDEREKHSEKTMAELYDPDKMPDGLREAHHNLDLAVERCYRSKPFTSDEERLEYLFKLYEKMTAKEKLGGLS